MFCWLAEPPRSQGGWVVGGKGKVWWEQQGRTQSGLLFLFPRE